MSKGLSIGAPSGGLQSLTLAPSVRSFQTTVGISNPLNVARPSGLAVGDLMVCAYESYASTAPGTPSGAGTWTVVGVASGGVDPDLRAGLYYRWASADDVAATNVASLTNPGTNFQDTHVIVWAVKDATGGIAHAVMAVSAAVHPHVIDSGYTPVISGDLFLSVTRGPDYTYQHVEVEEIEVATWVVDYASAPAHVVAFAHVSRLSAAATGNVGIDYNGGLSYPCGYFAVGGLGAPPAATFAVSRDSAGILIGVRDNAAPQFAVSRDADGIMLGAWR